MSAFIVSDYHINVLVSWAANQHGLNAVSYYWQGARRYVRDDAKRVANVLYAENVRSVNARCSEHEDPSNFHYQPVALGYAHSTPVQIIKACHCYEYQACETDDWGDSEACAIIDGIKKSAVRILPGYDEADWELNEPRKEAAWIAV